LGPIKQEVHLDEATIRVLRDIAGAVVTGIREVRADGAEDQPGPDSPSMFGLHITHITKAPNPPFDTVLYIVATVCADIRDALDKHLPDGKDERAKAAE
jgi:hypothetical protein